jgi:hypothetical protein
MRASVLCCFSKVKLKTNFWLTRFRPILQWDAISLMFPYGSAKVLLDGSFSVDCLEQDVAQGTIKIAMKHINEWICT